MTLTSGDDWTENPGATLIFRNSTFTANLADLDNGGVVNVGEFCTVRILGENNNFTENKCGVDGGVGSATSNSRIVIEGGTFANNQAGEVSSLVVFPPFLVWRSLLYGYALSSFI